MHGHTESVLPAAERKDSPCLGVSVEKQWRQQLSSSVLACHSLTKQKRTCTDLTQT